LAQTYAAFQKCEESWRNLKTEGKCFRFVKWTNFIVDVSLLKLRFNPKHSEWWASEFRNQMWCPVNWKNRASEAENWEIWTDFNKQGWWTFDSEEESSGKYFEIEWVRYRNDRFNVRSKWKLEKF
jgi:hypothetical protein